MPIGTPIPGQGLPLSFRTLDPRRLDSPNSGDVADENKLEVVFSIYRKPYATVPTTLHTPVVHRDNTRSIDRDGLPCRLRHVKMLPRSIAPATVIVGLSQVWWAKICSSDGDVSSFPTPLRDFG